MAAGAVSVKNLTKREEVRKLEKELIRLIMYSVLNNYFDSYVVYLYTLCVNCLLTLLYMLVAANNILVQV